MADEINEYDIGTGVVMEARFTKAGVAANPTTVTLTVKPPDKDDPDIVVEDVENPEVGLFIGEIEVTDHGDYYYRFQGTGTVVAAREGRFRVRKSRFVSGT
jgi:hypothetical protein